jgi:hypothetical protein
VRFLAASRFVLGRKDHRHSAFGTRPSGHRKEKGPGDRRDGLPGPNADTPCLRRCSCNGKRSSTPTSRLVTFASCPNQVSCIQAVRP